MASEARQYFPLANAYLCQDCDSVGNNSMHCPACGSGVLMVLASIFGRTEDAPGAKLYQFPAIAA